MKNRTDMSCSRLRGVAAWLVDLPLRMRRLRFAPSLLFLSVCLYLALPSMPVTAAPARKAVLVLFPYQNDLPNHEIAYQALREEFSSVDDLELDVYFEYLELIRFPDPVYQAQLFDLLAVKYRGKHIDLVILKTAVLSKIWLEQRSRILPDTPVVFYDTTTESIAAIQFPPDMTGISGNVDFTPSIQWILHARPSVNEIVLVYGAGQLERQWIQPVDILQEALGGRARITDLSGLPLDQIKQRVAALPPSSIVLYELMFTDAAGKNYRPVDVVQELIAISPVPVISGYDQYIGTGSIGGYMYSTEQQARDAGRIGIRILRGEDVSAIPIQQDQSNCFVFDYLALQRWHIPLSVLPADSIIKNRQYSLWEQYRPQLISLSVAVMGLLALVVDLGIVTRRLIIARQILREINTELEIRVQDRTAALKQTNGLLEAEVAELDTFAHTVAHDLKNPVGVVIGFAELLVTDYGLMSPEEVSRALNLILQTGKKLNTIIEELMLLAGVRKQEVTPKPLDMASIVQEAIKRLQLVIKDQQAQITLLDEEAWPVALGYGPWIEEVWANYISNAIKYGGQPPCVTVGAMVQPDGNARFWVKDNGPGLSAEAQANLFTPFTRLDQVKSKGHGLGLSVVRRIVERLDGQVGIESEIGHSSTFFFTLPTKQ